MARPLKDFSSTDGILERKTRDMTDNTRMTHGIYEGTKIASVPAAYLLHLRKDVEDPMLKQYVAENLDVLKLEAKRDRMLQSQRIRTRR
jgi:uncharacterized protein (DUF3820 family)